MRTAIATKREKTILWNAVITEGTGFFKTQTSQHVDARGWAWAKMQSAIDDAGREGADTEFLRSCTLYLAELAAADAFRNQETPHGVYSPGAMKALDEIKNTRRSIEVGLRKWMEARGTIAVIHHLKDERKVDAAYVILMKRLDAQIKDISLLFPEVREEKGRPPQDEMLHCLSGLRQHFENTIGTYRPLMHNLVSSLNPPLPIQVTSDHLRAVTHGYRKRKHTHGPTELESLQKEFKKLRKKFASSA